MDIRVDLEKTLEENAETYFSKAKKSRKKIVGATEALKQTKILLEQKQQISEQAQKQAALKKPKEYWYHKYRWSYTRNGNLLIGGQNASANESLIKHQTQPQDIVFHTDMAGSPFVILKPSKNPIMEDDLEDGAQFCAAYSRAWRNGIASLEVFYVKPDQVTKQAQSGESLPKGAFMIYGDTTYLHPAVEIGVGVIESEGFAPQVFAGSLYACSVHCTTYALLRAGKEKTSDVAKELMKTCGGDIDSYVEAIPAGGSQIVSFK